MGSRRDSSDSDLLHDIAQEIGAARDAIELAETSFEVAMQASVFTPEQAMQIMNELNSLSETLQRAVSSPTEWRITNRREFLRIRTRATQIYTVSSEALKTRHLEQISRDRAVQASQGGSLASAPPALGPPLSASVSRSDSCADSSTSAGRSQRLSEISAFGQQTHSRNERAGYQSGGSYNEGSNPSSVRSRYPPPSIGDYSGYASSHSSGNRTSSSHNIYPPPSIGEGNRHSRSSAYSGLGFSSDTGQRTSSSGEWTQYGRTSSQHSSSSQGSVLGRHPAALASPSSGNTIITDMSFEGHDDSHNPNVASSSRHRHTSGPSTSSVQQYLPRTDKPRGH